MGPLPSKDAAAAFGALCASVAVPPQPVRATAATVRDAVVARRVCQVRRRCLMCCSLFIGAGARWVVRVVWCMRNCGGWPVGGTGECRLPPVVGWFCGASWWVAWGPGGAGLGDVELGGAVEPRSMSRCGMIFGPRSRERSSFFTAIRPTPRAAPDGAQRRVHVQGGGGVVEAQHRDVSGTRSPRRCSSLMTAAPISPLSANIAVRPGRAREARRRGAAFQEEAAGGGRRGAVRLGHCRRYPLFCAWRQRSTRDRRSRRPMRRAERQQMSRAVGSVLVVDRHAGKARLSRIATDMMGTSGPRVPGLRGDRRRDEDDARRAVGAQRPQVAAMKADLAPVRPSITA